MEIQIPSPSVFLQSSPVVESIPPPPPVKKRPRPRISSTTVNSDAQKNGVIKPKQSKSRNGCLTCKKKRLKCDETKPSCHQCHRRNVECEGYKTTYKWRPFEETSFAAKTPTRAKKDTPEEFHDKIRLLNGFQLQESSSEPSRQQSWQANNEQHVLSSTAGLATPLKQLNGSPNVQDDLSTQTVLLSPGSLLLRQLDSDQFQFMQPLANTFDRPSQDLNSSSSSAIEDTSPKESTSTYSSNSPHLINLVLEGTDLTQQPDASEARPLLSPQPYPSDLVDELFDGHTNTEEVDEEIIRKSSQPQTSSIPPKDMLYRQSSPASSSSSSTSSRSSELTVCARPNFRPSSAEMLLARFDRQTCGILSVKDGQTENPWRTLVWPLARESPALYHAVFSMTAFHASSDSPELRMTGMKHMTKSMKELSNEISNERLDVALATALTLAFSQGWDEHVSTGIQHLRGAKAMVNGAVVKYNGNLQLGTATEQDMTRIKFLCNTFIYMDVIARLTSLEEDDNLDLNLLTTMFHVPREVRIEIDPLMGCASTLFPLIGGVAKLVQQVRRVTSNSPTLVSQAVELKDCIQAWRAPDKKRFEQPEDPHCEIEHSILTAEAYRLATLLHLLRAVPEIPSEPLELAKQILLKLSPVPPTSRAVIIQIFPLLVASCEVTDPSDREWVVKRWQDMIARMKIGNVTSCLQVVAEVWRRRDDYEFSKLNRQRRKAIARTMSATDFPPLSSSKSGKRKMQTVEAQNISSFLDTSEMNENVIDFDSDRGERKRRLTLDHMGMSSSYEEFEPGSFIRDDTILENEKFDYSVRGRLHWLGVMQNWKWEIFLG